MNSRANELAMGIFVIIFVLALGFLIMRVSGLAGNNLRDPYTMTATFDNVNGLKPRAKVTMSGVTIGRVTDISLDPLTHLSIVDFELDGQLTSFNAEQLKKVQDNALEELRISDGYLTADSTQRKVMEEQLLENMKSITSIDEDAFITVATNGLLGEKYLKVVPGGGINYVKRGGTVANTQGTMDLEDLISKFIASDKAPSISSSTDRSANEEIAFVE